MPEMVEFCGRRFRVANRVIKTCSYTEAGTNMRAFRVEDVVTLEGLRCSGAEHDGCAKGCVIFWRAGWLRKIEDAAEKDSPPLFDFTRLIARLRTRTGPTKYFCQASELLRATRPMPRMERLSKCLSEVRAGNCTYFQMARRLSVWLYWRIRRLFLGDFARGPNRSTPVQALNLRNGQLVQVKAMREIRQTMDAAGCNRGLHFSPDMRRLCGKTQCVDRRLDRMIVDGSGDMKQMPNTVFLEGSTCGCSHVAFGGCSRDEFLYWREIWLRPADGAQQEDKA
jgi:hypothetical protein